MERGRRKETWLFCIADGGWYTRAKALLSIYNFLSAYVSPACLSYLSCLCDVAVTASEAWVGGVGCYIFPLMMMSEDGA